MPARPVLSVRELQTRAFRVYPADIGTVDAFERDWRRMCAAAPTYERGSPLSFPGGPTRNYPALAWAILKFQYFVTNSAWQRMFQPSFSPYYDPEAPHSIGSPDGDNPWLDRFLFAKREFLSRLVIVDDHPQMRSLRRFPGSDVPFADLEPSLQAAIRDAKSEFVALFALSRHAPCPPIPDTSRAGRDPASKWFAAGGSFAVYSPELRRSVPLTDPGALRRVLDDPAIPPDNWGAADYMELLLAFGTILAHFPGGFGGAHAAAWRSRMRRDLLDSLADLIGNRRHSPFY